MASNHIVFIVMDSCRYDSMMAAATPNIDRLGQAEKRYSYASWTAPSHYAFTTDASEQLDIYICDVGSAALRPTAGAPRGAMIA